MSQRMRRNINFLAALKRASPAKKRVIIRKSTRPQISTLSEISKNILHNRIKLKPKQKRKLCKFKRLVRRMASRKVKYKTKKKALLRGGQLGVIPLLLTAGSIISNLISSRRKKK
jgi:hypothetical protein